jgi:hypothetical protein
MMYFSPHGWAVVILAFTLPFATGQSTKDIGQLFGIDRIVPDLLPALNPTLLLQVTYNTAVVPGQILSQNGASLKLCMYIYITNFLLQQLQCDRNLLLEDLPRILNLSF